MATKVEAWADSTGTLHASLNEAELADAEVAFKAAAALFIDGLADFDEYGDFKRDADDVRSWLAQSDNAGNLRRLLSTFDRLDELQPTPQLIKEPRRRRKK